MQKGERSSVADRDNWRSRVISGVAVVTCMALALLLGPRAGISGFLPGLLLVSVAVVIGTGLGWFVAGYFSDRRREGVPETTTGHLT